MRTLGNLVLAPGPNGNLVYHNGPDFWQETAFDWSFAGPLGRVCISLKVALMSPLLLISLLIGMATLIPHFLDTHVKADNGGRN